jgi:hypothetical protein
MRLAYAFLLLALVACTTSCSRHSLYYTPDGGDSCSALDPKRCASNPACELVTPCFCGTNPPSPNVCVTKGTVFACPNCSVCSSLGESACKQNGQCRADYCQECSCTPTFVGCVAVGAPPSACPGLGCDPPPCSCAGLDEKSCQAQSACTPNYCVGCNGAQIFSGCTAGLEPPPVCNNACNCHSSSDCAGAICVVPGGSQCGGVCRAPQSCTVDGDCTSGNVCELVACSCSGGKGCVPACTTTGCAVGESCGNDGHCTAIACSSAAQCPAFFDCVFLKGMSSHCERRACTSDGACGNGGYCVDGGCYSALGSCQQPVP